MIKIYAFIFVITMLTCTVAGQTDTTFTYQGELNESGNPANGSYNVDFALWDALNGGNQVGSTIQFNSLPVTDGLITVELDFGASVFDGSQLWLEITVDGNELIPRQPLTGSPYSIQTRGIFVDDAGNVGIGTTNPFWEFEVANLTPGDGVESGVAAEDAAGAIAAYSSTLPPPFDHFGGRVSLFGNAMDVRADSATGDMRFYTGGPLPANERMRITEDGKVGIGTTSPESTLHVFTHGSDDRAIVGRATGSVATGLYGHASSILPLINYGVYGKCDSPSGFDFFAGGAGANYGGSSSIRWKKNIESIDNPLYKTSQLHGVYFEWDEEHGGHHDVGMIAEEVGKILPEIVIYEENGVDAIGMDYSKLTPLLIEAVKALRAEKDVEIAELKQRINEMEHLVEKLISNGTEYTQ